MAAWQALTDEIGGIAVSRNNISENTMWTDCDPQGTPTEFKGMPGGGMRFFPDFDYPNQSRLNRDRCILHITGGIPGAKVFLKSFDVDDPTDDSKVDTNGPEGNDNFGPVPQAPGRFANTGNARDEVVLNSSGEAMVEFHTTSHPGDNFRVALSYTPDKQNTLGLHTLQVTSPGTLGFVSYGTDTHVPAVAVIVSPLLTVWRRLRVEIDSMAPLPI